MCIIDDASMMNEPMTLAPILRSNRFVLLGNYAQQQPKARSKLAQRKGLGTSMLERMSRLDSKDAQARVCVIKKQHRMTRHIMIYVNKLLNRPVQDAP